MFCLCGIHHQGAAHNIAQPCVQDGVQTAAGPQFVAAESPGKAVSLRHAFGLADDVQGLADGGVLQLTAGYDSGRATDLNKNKILENLYSYKQAFSGKKV